MTTTHPVAAEDDLSPLCSPSFLEISTGWQILLAPDDGSRRRHGRRGDYGSPPLVYVCPWYTHTPTQTDWHSKPTSLVVVVLFASP